MKLEINEKEKLVMFWLTGSEQKDDLLRERMSREFAAYKQQKYIVAVMCSGKSDLQDVTTDLLLHNQKVAARRDLAREQEYATFACPALNI